MRASVAEPFSDAGDDLGDAAGGEAELGGDGGLWLAVDGDAVEDLLVAVAGDGVLAIVLLVLAGVQGAVEDGSGVIGHGFSPEKGFSF